MKNLKFIVAIIIGIITITTSCKKDEEMVPMVVEKQPNYILGEELDKSIVDFSQQLAYELKQGFYMDTNWTYDDFGNHILDGDGLPLYNGVKKIDVTANTQFEKLTNMVKDVHEGLKYQVIDYYNQHSIDTIMVGFPEETLVISKVLENGRYYTDSLNLMSLNNLSSLVLTEPNITINEKISNIFKDAEGTLQGEAKAYFIEFATELLGGKNKSAIILSSEADEVEYVEYLIQQFKELK